MATSDLQKILVVMVIIPALMSPRVSMSLQPRLTMFRKYGGTSDLLLSGQYATVPALSRVHCAIECKKFPHCTSFGYDAHVSLCLLSSQIPGTPSSRDVTNNASTKWSVYKDAAPDCQEPVVNITHGSVTTQRSLWTVNGSITCDNDYYLPQNMTSVITCLSDGSWPPLNAQCVQYVWRYPETKQLASKSLWFKLPDQGTVGVGWSACVEGYPTNKTSFQIEICPSTSCNDQTVHTSWRFAPLYTPALVVNDRMNATWGTAATVTSPPFPLNVGELFYFKLTVSTSTAVDIYMNNQYFYRKQLRFPLSSFSVIVINNDANVTKVDTWCRN